MSKIEANVRVRTAAGYLGTVRSLMPISGLWCVRLDSGPIQYAREEHLEVMDKPHVPQAGDAYVVVGGSGIKYTLTSGADSRGIATCTYLTSEGVVCNSIIRPDKCTYAPPKPVRPAWPKLKYPKRWLSAVAAGSLSVWAADDGDIAYIDLDEPSPIWRWEDGTPVTDEERGLT